MIGRTLSHYKVLEKVTEPSLMCPPAGSSKETGHSFGWIGRVMLRP